MISTEKGEADSDAGYDTTRGAIDVHSHLIPSFLVEEVLKSAEPPPGLMLPAARAWTADGTLEQMDRHGVATSVLSAIPLYSAMSRMKGQEVARMVRRVNEFATTLRHAHRGRLGLFSFLPMPDVERSLQEIEYSLDTLQADGVGLFTTYGDQSIADPAFRPLLEELDHREAVVFCHPDLPNSCGEIDGLMGYPYDTGRAVFGLLLKGTLNRFPAIRWIFCHGGGPVPVLAGRVREMSRLLPSLQQVAPQGVDHELRRLYYETGNAANSPSMSALLDYVPIPQVLFGTDAPYFGLDSNLDLLRANRLSTEQLKAIEHDNALRLLPGLR